MEASVSPINVLWAAWILTFSLHFYIFLTFPLHVLHFLNIFLHFLHCLNIFVTFVTFPLHFCYISFTFVLHVLSFLFICLPFSTVRLIFVYMFFIFGAQLGSLSPPQTLITLNMSPKSLQLMPE